MTERLNDVERRTNYILKRIKDLIELGRSTFYLPEYRPSIPQEEILGVIVAKYCEWKGERIIKVFLSALEDANYHTLRSQIEELLEKQNLTPFEDVE
jgi:hypothetical protein